MNQTSNSSTLRCGVLNPLHCDMEKLGEGSELVVFVTISLGVAVCALYILVAFTAVALTKLAELYNNVVKRLDAVDGADSRKSAFAPLQPSLKKSSKLRKGIKQALSEDTSCAAPRDLDEEEL